MTTHHVALEALKRIRNDKKASLSLAKVREREALANFKEKQSFADGLVDEIASLDLTIASLTPPPVPKLESFDEVNEEEFVL